MSKRHWDQWWWKDWRSDAGLQRCGLRAQGLWMQMLCLMAEDQNYGRLTANGVPICVKTLANLTQIRRNSASRLLQVLEQNGVFERDEDGVIFSRRLRKEQKLREAGSEGARRRWAENANGHPTGAANAKKQKQTTEGESPLTPRKRGEGSSKDRSFLLKYVGTRLQ